MMGIGFKESMIKELSLFASTYIKALRVVIAGTTEYFYKI